MPSNVVATTLSMMKSDPFFSKFVKNSTNKKVVKKYSSCEKFAQLSTERITIEKAFYVMKSSIIEPNILKVNKYKELHNNKITYATFF